MNFKKNDCFVWYFCIFPDDLSVRWNNWALFVKREMWSLTDAFLHSSHGHLLETAVYLTQHV